MALISLTDGSLWRRWDPHVHSPETILNDQYRGPDPWDKFFDRLEKLSPTVEAIGLTDYYLLENYEKTRAAKAAGRLPSVSLIFPNVEMRLAIAAERSKPVNLHLLIAPDDLDHVAQARRFLGGLEFKVPGDTYRCTRDDLIRLGRKHDSEAISDKAALKVGANQFKVEIDQFIDRWDSSDWIQNNALIAVATSRRDGTSSLQKDASLTALRQKVEHIAHIMFAPTPGDRAFWLGQGAVGVEEIKAIYGALKPCLHGSDAHRHEDVATPAKERYCWIKGELTFDALCQTYMEPEHRAFVGAAHPSGPAPSQFIQSVSVRHGAWFVPETVPLNPGLVGIIGARGSGKTALADMIAAGGYSLSDHMNERSFVHRARDYFNDDTAELTWGDGEITGNKLKEVEFEGIFNDPHVQYLSQHFVEILCSSGGVTDKLVSEIERVIFDAHSPETRQGASNFKELMDEKAALGRQQRADFERSIVDTGDHMARERDKLDLLESLKAKVATLKTEISRDERSKKSLVTKDSTTNAEDFERVSSALEEVRQRVSQWEKQKGGMVLLKAHVGQRRGRIAKSELMSLRATHVSAGFSEQEWEAFLTDFIEDVDKLLETKMARVEGELRKLKGSTSISSTVETDNKEPSRTTLLPRDVPLEKCPLSTLNAEARRLEALLGIDKRKRDQLKRLTDKIAQAHVERTKLEKQIQDANGAQGRIAELLKTRNSDYAGIFEGILAEETALKELYAPLSAQLATEKGAVARLSVSIKRNVDVHGWAERGEALLDLRRADGFRGKGALLETVRNELQSSWETGNADEVAQIMATFREQHRQKFAKGAPYDRRTDLPNYRRWAKELSQWIYGTDHIKVTYSLQYDGVEIERLSPGTRGIVLLLLYLALDNKDDRPLIIDQPEENLDPKSIFDELVGRFRSSKTKRQIIIVTHNANLIVNADADQVIVATCGPHNPGALPKISYESGGLEDPRIRKHVCDILEGGETAFRERAKRLRVKFSGR